VQKQARPQTSWNAIKDFFDRVFKRYKRTPFISLEMEDAMKLLHKEYDKLERLYKDALGATRKVRTKEVTVSDNSGVMYAKSGLTSDESSDKINEGETAEQRLKSKHIVYAKTYAELNNNPELKRLYAEAKKGNDDNAFELVQRLVTNEFADNLKRQYGNAIIVPVVGMIDSSNNTIPSIFATYLKDIYSFEIFEGITKVTNNKMTGKKTSERVGERIEYNFEEKYSSKDIQGKHFVIADDTINTGTTTMALAKFIADNGGYVDGFVSLCKGQDKVMDMEISDAIYQKLVNIVKGDYDEQFIKQEATWLTDKSAREFVKNPRKWRTYLEQRRSTQNGGGNIRTSEQGNEKTSRGQAQRYSSSQSEVDELNSKSPKRASKLKDITPEYVRGEVTRDFESFKKLIIGDVPVSARF